MLRVQIDRERAKKLDLKHLVQVLERDLERHECKIDELRVDRSR